MCIASVSEWFETWWPELYISIEEKAINGLNQKWERASNLITIVAAGHALLAAPLGNIPVLSFISIS
jgi:hypothetical protein